MEDDPIATMNRIQIYGHKQRVKWEGAKAGSWATGGEGTVVGFSSARPYFGGRRGTGQDTPGPAYEIQLDGERNHRVWVGPGEIAAI